MGDGRLLPDTGCDVGPVATEERLVEGPASVRRQPADRRDYGAERRVHDGDRAHVSPAEQGLKPVAVGPDHLVRAGRDEGAVVVGQGLERSQDDVGNDARAPARDKPRLVNRSPSARHRTRALALLDCSG